MDSHQNAQDPSNVVFKPPQDKIFQPPPPQPDAVHRGLENPNPSAPPPNLIPGPPNENPYDVQPIDSYEPIRPSEFLAEEKQQKPGSRRLSKKWQRRLYWMVPLGIVVIVFAVLFEVYKKDFERWVRPLTDWLRKREAWSWTIPVVILVILSFPPLFGHEIVQLVVGLTYPLGVALGIACAGAVIGEAACFIVFKYGFTGWVEKKIASKVKWAAVARVTQEAGFRGVLVIRYSIVPPHLANPLFSCTGMKFWLYMATVILSLPKSIVFVALGTPSSEGSKAVKWAKVAVIGVVVGITIFASIWIRKKMIVAIRDIKAERAEGAPLQSDEELEMLNPPVRTTVTSDTSYHGVGSSASISSSSFPYGNAPGVAK